MPWTQIINPLGSPGLSALVAALPVLFFLFALAVLRMKGYAAGLLTLAGRIKTPFFPGEGGLPLLTAYRAGRHGGGASLTGRFFFGNFPQCPLNFFQFRQFSVGGRHAQLF